MREFHADNAGNRVIARCSSHKYYIQQMILDSLSALEGKRLFEAARTTLLATLPNVWAIYVYGSFARGEEWPQSDLDLAVLLPPEQTIF
jgi:UTP:GlnB (protein PII) uridylyltransferase